MFQFFTEWISTHFAVSFLLLLFENLVSEVYIRIFFFWWHILNYTQQYVYNFLTKKLCCYFWKEKKKWFTGKGNANNFSILALRIPWTIWKGKKLWCWKTNPRSVDVQYVTGEEQKNSSRKNEEFQKEPSPAVHVSGDESKVNAVRTMLLRNVES